MSLIVEECEYEFNSEGIISYTQDQGSKQKIEGEMVWSRFYDLLKPTRFEDGKINYWFWAIDILRAFNVAMSAIMVPISLWIVLVGFSMYFSFLP